MGSLLPFLRGACVALCSLLCACGAQSKEIYVIARLDMPPSALLLFEHFATRDVDRTSNWRFMIRNDGAFFNARNQQLFVTQASQRGSDDPSLFFNTPFPERPQRVFRAEQLAELQGALTQVESASLQGEYPSNKKSSNPSAERWTFAFSSGTRSVVVEDSQAPAELVNFRKTIDRLVAAAPRE